MVLEQGISQSAAAREMGISSPAVSQTLRRIREQAQIPPLTSRRHEAARYLKENGGTLASAGARFGITRQSVHQGWLLLFEGEPLPSQTETP